jgi:hypothetical protein
MFQITNQIKFYLHLHQMATVRRKGRASSSEAIFSAEALRASWGEADPMWGLPNETIGKP